jgi:anti-anti-sigma factor
VSVEYDGLTVDVHRVEDAASVYLTGELDLLNANAVREQLATADGIERLHLDLSGVSFLDVNGATAIRDVCTEAESRGAIVTVAGHSAVAAIVLEIVGAGRLTSS